MDTQPSKNRHRKRWALVAVAALTVLMYTQLTLFVVPPIGAVPEGRTIVMLRLSNMKFVDSADAVCERIQDGVSLLCRAAVLGAIGENATILARLPYSSILYSVSTGGRTYEW